MKRLLPPVSGSLAGETAHRGPAGVQFSRRTVPVQRRSVLQMRQRARMADLTRRWGALSDDERAAWRASPPDGLSGHMWYVRINLLLRGAGWPIVSVPPAGGLAYDVPQLRAFVHGGADPDQQNITVGINRALTADLHMLVRLSALHRSGAQSVRWSGLNAVITSTVVLILSPESCRIGWARPGMAGQAQWRVVKSDGSSRDLGITNVVLT